MRKALIGIMALSGLLSGCAALQDEVGRRIEQSLKTAIEVDERCEAVADALLASRSAQSGSLEEAIRARITGVACKPGGKDCDDAGLLLQVRQDVQQMQAAASALNQALLSTADWPESMRTWVRTRAESDRLEDLFRQTRADLEAVRKAVSKALRAQNHAFDCQERTQCIQDLARRFEAASTEIADIRGAMGRVQSRAQAAEQSLRVELATIELAWQTLRARSNPPAELDTQFAQLLEAQRRLLRSLASMRGSVQAGLGAFEGLLARQVQSAASDFLGARFHGAVASRALDVVERGLQPLDRLIDRADERAYGLVTASVIVFDDELRQKVGKLSDELNRSLLKSTDARLAFASAACDRIRSLNTKENPSVLLPIFLDMFTRAYVHEQSGRTGESLRLDFTKPAKDVSTALRKARVDVPVGLGAVVERCTGGELAVRDLLEGAGRPPGEIRVLAQRVCNEAPFEPDKGTGAEGNTGAALMNAAGAQLDLTALRSARASVERLVPVELVTLLSPQSPRQTNEVVRVEVIREVVRESQGTAPGAGKEPVAGSMGEGSGARDLCEAISPGLLGAKCFKAETGWHVEFEHRFGVGKHDSQAIERSLVSLGEALGRLPAAQMPAIRVFGQASSSSIRRDAEGGCLRPSVTTTTRDEQLARRRAAWALSVLGSRYAPARLAEPRTLAASEAIPCDSAWDRRVFVQLLPMQR